MQQYIATEGDSSISSGDFRICPAMGAHNEIRVWRRFLRSSRVSVVKRRRQSKVDAHVLLQQKNTRCGAVCGWISSPAESCTCFSAGRILVGSAQLGCASYLSALRGSTIRRHVTAASPRRALFQYDNYCTDCLLGLLTLGASLMMKGFSSSEACSAFRACLRCQVRCST